MGSYNRERVFDPLDLEIIDQVYAAIWANVEGREPFRDKKDDGARQHAIRKRIFVFANLGTVDFDLLCDKVVANMPGSWVHQASVPGPEVISAKARQRRLRRSK